MRWVTRSLVSIVTAIACLFLIAASNSYFDVFHAKLTNGDCIADVQSGSNIGSKINACINTLGTGGGIIRVPPGSYSFSTTIQCNKTAHTGQVIISGAGRGTDAQTQGATYLAYTGSGDAINQVTNQQNETGCILENLVLDGVGAGASAVGYHFGGTAYSGTYNVLIQNFSGAAIELENPNGMFTERYNFYNTNLYYNKVGIYFHCDAGCLDSAEHGNIDIWQNTTPNNTALKLDGGIVIQNTNIKINGNVEGTGTNGTLFTLAGASKIQGSFIFDNTECDETSCYRFDVDATSSVTTYYVGNQRGGTFTDNIAGGGVVTLYGLNTSETGGYTISAPNFTGGSTASIGGGGGVLAAGSNSFMGKITGTAAGGNKLVPGFTCPNQVIAIFSNITGGTLSVSAADTTSITFSVGSAGDTVYYIAGCI